MADAIVDTEVLANAIGTAIADGLQKHSPKQVSFGEYERRRLAGRPKLTREVWQTGVLVNPEVLNDREVTLLNRIVRPGRYIDRRVEIVMRDENTVEIHYTNAKHDHRMENKSYWRNFEELLQKVVAEQDVELAEEQRMREARQSRPGTFDTKATREARAAAEAREAARG